MNIHKFVPGCEIFVFSYRILLKLNLRHTSPTLFLISIEKEAMCVGGGRVEMHDILVQTPHPIFIVNFIWNMFSIREELIFNLEIHQVKDSHAPNIYIMYKPCCSFFQFHKIWTKHHRYGSCSAWVEIHAWPCIWNTTLNQSINQNQILYALLFCYVAKRA